MENIDVLTYGEAMAMFVASETGDLSKVNHFTKKIAGAELNVSIGLSRLGFNVAWLSRVGSDSFGNFVFEQLAKENICSDLVTVDTNNPTGFVIKSKVLDGSDPVVEYFRKGSAASKLSIQDFNAKACTKAKHLHLSGVAAGISESSYQLAHYMADHMRSAEKTVSFDPNLRPVLWNDQQKMKEQINALAFKANWVLPGIKEGQILTGLAEPNQIADFYLEKGVDIVIIKLGAEGAYFKDKKNINGIIPPFLVEKVVDTVGAGDGFAVGVISALLEGKALVEAVSRGNRIGSLAIQVSGDSEGLPTRELLDSLEK